MKKHKKYINKFKISLPISKVINVIFSGMLFEIIVQRLIQILTINKIDYYNCNYDEVVSLGYNCEISQRFCDIFKNKNFEHFLYTWSYERDRDLFLKSFSLFDNFAESSYRIVQNGMFRHELSGIEFHSRYNKNELIDVKGNYTDKYFEAEEELKSRLNYIAEKTKNIFTKNKKTLFIIKIKYQNIDKDLQFIKDLSDIIKNTYNNQTGKFLIVVVLSKRDYPKQELQKLSENQIDFVKFEVIKNFASDKNTDITGDIIGWHRLLRKYIRKKD